MKYHRKGFHAPESLVVSAILVLLAGILIPAIIKVRQTSINAQKESQSQTKYQPPSPEVIQQRQEAARKRAEERQQQEEIERQAQLELEKENAVYEITFIQIDRERNFNIYTLRHKRNNTEYLLVVTPEGSSITPLLKPQ